jgi:hypothetical protein
MSRKQIDIKYGRLFPWPFLLIAIIIFIVAVSLIIEKPIVAGVLVAVSGFILTGYEGTVIDKTSRTYLEYKSFFFFKTGRKKKYSDVEKIFVNISKSTQRLYTAHTSHSSTFSNVDFNAFLKFNDGEKIKLKSKRSKAHLIKYLEPISRFLNVPIEDNSGRNSRG